MNTKIYTSILLHTSISIVLLSTSLLSDESEQMRQIDLNEKKLLTLFEKENSKTKKNKEKEKKEKEKTQAETNQSS